MNKNIMLLISQLRNGGAEHSIINLANELSNMYNVVLVTANMKNPDYVVNVPVIEIEELKSKRIISKLIGIMKLKKLKRKYHIDVTISYTTVFNFYNVIAKYRDRTIISVRNHLSAKKEGKIFDFVSKIIAKRCDYVVCCSESVKVDQIKNYHVKESKIKVINNFCDEEQIHKTLEKKVSLSDRALMKDDFFVTLARLVPHKGHKHIIKALSLVVKTYPKTKLLIFGRGSLEEDLKSLVKEYKLENNVVFMGFRSDNCIFLKEAKGCILASDFEGFPNVIIEAMACGTPVIATDTPGGSKEILCKNEYHDNNSVASLVKADYGLLVPSLACDHEKKSITKNELELKKAMELLLSNAKIYQHYHKKSLERIKAYNKKDIVAKWLEIIE